VEDTKQGGNLSPFWSVAPYRRKRVFDWLIVALVGPPAALLVTLAAIAVKVTSPGPVFFRQERVGWRGRPFTVVKLRTMMHDPGGNPLFPDDERITAVGRWLRRLSLDEVPQLWNVAMGDMSVVGPRPTLPYQVARYDERQRQRLAVRPGITGLAQVRGRNRVSWPERIEMDLEYIEKQSVRLDLKVLWWSVAAVVRGTDVSGHPQDDPLARVG
jgi:lipopolysaccharide/colanic/teichoic acid biosynthesis glycosyltransferase